jgi:predicted AAA+ superfamily ATPase
VISRSGIDFIFENNGSLIPVEVKYQRRAHKSDYLGMKRVFGKGIIITREEVFKGENIVGIPAWFFFAIFDE